ncbi:hypothetical protein FC093_14185 [Ilyomonas limi]|uniref:Uncharacterized protein n=1 Tax=Ilyomonas limi TaxID=2575867 RepID=A0A4U3KYI9_9BACT|nr:hypothetical protein [Ilyomonas limi]TKK67442.1 hypothetical protein FC093_14185 [Ilyomonas limi]
MKSIITLLWAILFFPTTNYCQLSPVASENNILICCQATAPDNEFSGLLKWRNFVLLIPQHVSDTDMHNIIAIDTLSIDSVLQHQADSVYHYTTIIFDTSLHNIIHSIQQTIGKHNKYGGFEAAVAVDDSIFFTVETDSLCYVVKGVIKEKEDKYRVVFKPKDILALQKPNYRFDNAGFESLTYLPASKKLVALYENNNLSNAVTGYTFNTDFTHKQSLQFNKPLLFRLTDITAIKDSAGNDALLGMNFFYNDFKKDTGRKATEFNYYFTGDTNKVYTSKQLTAAQSQLHGGNLLKDCFSRVISLHIHNNTVSWQEEEIISYQCDNWEGITSYKKGVLLMVDGKPPGVNCRLSYFELDNQP